MFRSCLLSIFLSLIVLGSCSDKNNPANFSDENLFSSKLAEIEIGGIAAQREHLRQGQSGPYYHFESRDTTSYEPLYSFHSDLYDPSMCSLQDSGAALLYTMTGYVDYIQIRMTLDPEGRFIRSLIINDWRGMQYYADGRTMLKLSASEIPRVPAITHKYVFEVRGEALAAVLQNFEHVLEKKWAPYGVSWEDNTYTLLPGYKITPESYLRITLSR